jgi:hypothetical protein
MTEFFGVVMYAYKSVCTLSDIDATSDPEQEVRGRYCH